MANELKATPGPYMLVYRFNNDQHDDKCCSIEGDDFILAEICGDVPESRANAHLFSASWELYHLLEESQTSIGGDWRKRRDAALAKARGEQ